ncbi:MAG: hypothetical protein KAR12_13820, partial [Methylococcales bacterium]|nr:hypothetical protein [Methylococcales bacterium]
MSSGKQKETKSGQKLKHSPGYGGWWFLLAVLMLHLGVRIIEPTFSTESLDYFVKVLYKLLPAFGLMFLLLWLFNLFANPQQISRYQMLHSGLKGWMFATAGGIISMGSMYLWYPLLQDLKANGMRTSLLASFLYSRAIKIPMLPFMVHYFGTLYTILFVFNIVLFSVASGLMMERIVMKTPEDTDPCKRNQ